MTATDRISRAAVRAGESGSPTSDAVPPRLALCLVNHDGERHLRESLPSVAERADAFDELVLVDGGSRDGSLALASDHLPSLHVVRLAGNPGPGAARNAGLRATRSELVLFVDNDVRLEDGVPERLVQALAARPGAAVAVPRVLYACEPDRIQYEGAEAHFLGLMAPRHADRPADEPPLEPTPIGSLVTACFLLDRRRWGPDAPFDESFVFNLEDHDFGVRCRLRGLEIVAVPSARVLHGSGTPGLSLRPGGRQAPLRVYCLIRNRWLILLKSFALRTLVVLAPALALYEAAQLGGAVRRGWLREYGRAGAWILTHAGEIARRRAAVQRSRRIGDRDLLRGGPLPLTAEVRSGWLERAAIGAVERATAVWWRLARGAL